MALRDEIPLEDRGIVDENDPDPAAPGEDELLIEEQFSLSSYGASDFFVSSAYSRLPTHTQPVFSKRALAFAWSFLVLKPLQLVAMAMYYGETGRLYAPLCVASAVAGYYVAWIARALLLYVNVKRDRLPLAPSTFWALSLWYGGAALVALLAAAQETFGADGVFRLVAAGQARQAADPLRAHALGTACGAAAALWVAAADSFAAAANFCLARFWARTILNAPVAF
ncbi:envelope protein UL20 [Cercopithecine alphaherpesvirus 2]|uniref:Integral membrane protein n=1 Tax=Cercopithecine alphaherpesvirus 2 TaxID=10317 RepID=Q805V5_9ALPH|nr:envelope protein UL20 [Cercopithecine alphaherpesvirus 2]AAU88085.1 virion membrane protein [Cercopithecine alphaherpesvirus 2]BAC58114.1 integral membrane protein [Cercopithecine alphaherpesvirus 2]